MIDFFYNISFPIQKNKIVNKTVFAWNNLVRAIMRASYPGYCARHPVTRGTCDSRDSRNIVVSMTSFPKRMSTIKETCLMADDLWLKFMELVRGYKVVKTRAKVDRMKKARIYKDETAAPVIETKEEGDVPDWFAFQKKFSNQNSGFTMNTSQQPQEARTDNTEDEEESELDALFRGLYDDDKS